MESSLELNNHATLIAQMGELTWIENAQQPHVGKLLIGEVQLLHVGNELLYEQDVLGQVVDDVTAVLFVQNQILHVLNQGQHHRVEGQLAATLGQTDHEQLGPGLSHQLRLEGITGR